MKTPEEVKDAIIDSLAQDTAGGLQLPSATTIIAADRKEAVAEFVRELNDYCSLRDSECAANGKRKQRGFDTEGAAFFCGKAGAFREVAVELQGILKRKGIDL